MLVRSSTQAWTRRISTTPLRFRKSLTRFRKSLFSAPAAPSRAISLDTRWKWNEEQNVVVNAAHSVVVDGGAGSGKTHALVSKMVHLLQTNQAEVSRILMLSSSSSSSVELQRLVDEAAPIALGCRVLTLWEFIRMVYEEPPTPLNSIILASHEDAPRLLSYREMLLFLEENVHKLPLKSLPGPSDPFYSTSKLYRFMINMSSNVLFESEIRAHAKKQSPKLAAVVDDMLKSWNAFEDLKVEAGVMDMADATRRLLKDTADDEVKTEFARLYSHVMVDDVQFLPPLSVQLLKGIAQAVPMTIAQDSTQRLGSPSYTFDDFDHTITFHTSHRLSGPVLDGLQNLMTTDPGVGVNSLKFAETSLPKTKLNFNEFDRWEDEIDFVCRIAVEAVNDGQSVVIASQLHSKILRPLAKMLMSYGVHCEGEDSVIADDASACPTVATIKAFLHVVCDMRDDASMFTVLHGAYGVTPAELAKLMQRRGFRDSLWDVVESQNFNGLDDGPWREIKIKLSEIWEDIEKYRADSLTIPTSHLVLKFLQQRKILPEEILNQMNHGGEIDGVSDDVLAHFLQKIVSTEVSAPSDKAMFVTPLLNKSKGINTEFLLHLDSEDSKANGPRPVYITSLFEPLKTEFDQVFVVGMADSVWPGRPSRHYAESNAPELLLELSRSGNSIEAAYAERQRRLLGLVMSRARNGVTFTSSKSYAPFLKRRQVRSRFLAPTLLGLPDLPGVALDECEKIPSTPSRQAEIARGSANEAVVELPELTSLSFSKLSTYERCPKKFYYSYVLCLSQFENEPMLYGSCLHKTAELYLSQRARGINMPAAEAFTHFKNYWNAAHPTLQGDALYYRGLHVVEQFIRRYKGIKVSPDTLLEEEFEFQVDGVAVRGHWDWVDTVNHNKGVREFKSHLSNSAISSARSNMQLQIYALAYLKRFGESPMVTLECLETGKHAHVRYDIPQLEKVEAKLGTAITEMRKDTTLDAKPDKMNCSYCGYRDICPKAI